MRPVDSEDRKQNDNVTTRNTLNDAKLNDKSHNKRKCLNPLKSRHVLLLCEFVEGSVVDLLQLSKTAHEQQNQEPLSLNSFA